MKFNQHEPNIEVIGDVYNGEIISSNEEIAVPKNVEIHSLRNQNFKVLFTWKMYIINFRGTLVTNEDGIIITIQEEAGDEFVLNGIDGFLPGTPKAHGGLIQLLNGVFFNISLSYYSGALEELYFFGKKKEITTGELQY